MADKKIDYEKSVQELEQMVRQMESGEMPLGELSEKLKHAQTLLKACKERLTATEAEIRKILGTDE